MQIGEKQRPKSLEFSPYNKPQQQQPGPLVAAESLMWSRAVERVGVVDETNWNAAIVFTF